MFVVRLEACAKTFRIPMVILRSVSRGFRNSAASYIKGDSKGVTTSTGIAKETHALSLFKQPM
jgi:hypothetical protein